MTRTVFVSSTVIDYTYLYLSLFATLCLLAPDLDDNLTNHMDMNCNIDCKVLPLFVYMSGNMLQQTLPSTVYTLTMKVSVIYFWRLTIPVITMYYNILK